jgi:aspartate carbamoyltransferase regulatory subunit
MIIGSIVNGIVIDHIPAGRGMELYTTLELEKLDCEVALIKNATSIKRGKKDILKIGELIPLNYDVLGYIDPKITVNIIEDGKRIKKMHPSLPETITGVIKCKNPRCITSAEQELLHVFKLTDRENIVYRCIYCETKAENIRERG